jgi:SAM-dependent methyltransferase
VGRQVRGERSGPIGISGGDFATPTARKRTTTQPRGVPVVGAAPRNGTPPPAREGAQPESPFGAPPTSDLGDAASQLAAEAAAVRALDSGPLTPPPVVDDPGPTPPPESVSRGADAPADEVASEQPPESGAQPEAAESVAEPDAGGEPALHVEEVQEDREEQEHDEEAPTESAAPLVGEDVPLPEAAMASSDAEGSDAEAPATDGPPMEPPVASTLAESLQALTGGADLDAGTSEDHFSAQETPWPELSQQGAGMRAPTPVPGAIPTDAMGGDSGGERAGAEVEAAEPSPAEDQPRDDADVAAGDDLELDETADGAEALDTLPAEAFAEGGAGYSSAPEAVSQAPPPAPRAAAAPPPIPAGSPRRKTGEMRAPEVPAAQVVASIVPAIPAGAASLPEALAQRPRRPKRSKPWFEEVFDEDYLRTLPFMSADQTLREVEFIESSLAVKPGAQVLDVGCGYGRHAIELVQRGLDVTGLDLSLPLLLRAADEAQRRAMSVNFVHADMREMAFEKQFDGAYCMLTSFGYFDEDTNLRVAEGIGRSLKAGGRFLLDIVNRDYIVSDLPSRVWWEGNGCVVLEEVDFNFHTSRVLTHRSIVFEDGRQLEQEISVRAYSLHEIGRLLRQAGFRVLEISGALATRGHFFGVTSRSLLILAEKRPEEG